MGETRQRRRGSSGIFAGIAYVLVVGWLAVWISHLVNHDADPLKTWLPLVSAVAFLWLAIRATIDTVRHPN